MRRITVGVLTVALLALGGMAHAADDPTGTWKWTQTRGDQSIEMTLKLKLEDGKLTGSISGRNNRESPIEEGTFKDGELSFKVTRERQGQKFTTSYSGKLSGDTIKGTVEFERNGQKQSRDWEAKRAN